MSFLSMIQEIMVVIEFKILLFNTFCWKKKKKKKRLKFEKLHFNRIQVPFYLKSMCIYFKL